MFEMFGNMDSSQNMFSCFEHLILGLATINNVNISQNNWRHFVSIYLSIYIYVYIDIDIDIDRYR